MSDVFGRGGDRYRGRVGVSRLDRFEDYRYIGTRDSMRVYDCDEANQFSELEERIAEDGLLAGTQLTTFSPDTLEEAANRGFKRV